jgi:DNA-binding CsgD family transcriptional regulator
VKKVEESRVSAQLGHELTGVSDSDDFFEATASMLRAIFHCDGVAWNHIDLTRRTAWLRGTPVELEDENTASLLAYHAHDHPVIRSYRESPSQEPRRMSDLASRTQLRRTGSFSEVMRPLGINFQLSILTTRTGEATGAGWAMSQQAHDFSDDDVELATRIQAVLSLLTYRQTRSTTPVATDAQRCCGLTPRELEVLRLVALGHTAHAVSTSLSIAPATVRKHLERVYAKLGTHDRLLAVRRAQSLGLIPTDHCAGDTAPRAERATMDTRVGSKR